MTSCAPRNRSGVRGVVARRAVDHDLLAAQYFGIGNDFGHGLVGEGLQLGLAGCRVCHRRIEIAGDVRAERAPRAAGIRVGEPLHSVCADRTLRLLLHTAIRLGWPCEREAVRLERETFPSRRRAGELRRWSRRRVDRERVDVPVGLEPVEAMLGPLGSAELREDEHRVDLVSLRDGPKTKPQPGPVDHPEERGIDPDCALQLELCVCHRLRVFHPHVSRAGVAHLFEQRDVDRSDRAGLRTRRPESRSPRSGPLREGRCGHARGRHWSAPCLGRPARRSSRRVARPKRPGCRTRRAPTASPARRPLRRASDPAPGARPPSPQVRRRAFAFADDSSGSVVPASSDSARQAKRNGTRTHSAQVDSLFIEDPAGRAPRQMRWRPLWWFIELRCHHPVGRPKRRQGRLA